MPAAVSVRRDFSAGELRRLAAATKNANQSRRLLSLAAVLDGMNRAQAARIGGMDRQTLRDWVHRFNAHGPDGLKDSWSKGNPPRLSADQQAELAQLVETGPDRVVQGVVRWRRIDLQRAHRRALRRRLPRAHGRQDPQELGFSHISARRAIRLRMGRPSRRSKTYGPPRPQEAFARCLTGLRKRIRSRGPGPGQDGVPRALVLIKLSASSAIF